MHSALDSDITYVKGIGPKKALVLKNEAGIETVEDILYYIPRRYIDRSTFKSIKDCFMNEVVTVAGTIKKVRIQGRSHRFLEVEIDDGTDTLSGIFFGGVQYFTKIFHQGGYVLFSGKIGFYRKKQIVHPDFDFIDPQSSIQPIHTGRIIPLYRSTEKLKSFGFDSRGFRRLMKTVLDRYLDHIEETIDASILKKLNLVDIRDAIFTIHFPDSLEKAEAARKRLSFNEIFFLQYYLSMSKRYLRENNQLKKRKINETRFHAFISTLPYELTGDQKKAIDEVRGDLASPSPMNRLLQGDVGSGKTVVAMASSLLAVGRGSQVAVMAPTEILASQHYQTFMKLMPAKVAVSLLTGSTPQNEKAAIYRALAEGDTDIVIGTHALIQGEVKFKNLGLTIIDEQHRFGVAQRALLRKKGNDADLLVMTATPIPRSLYLTLYGDLDISSLREKPANRPLVKTLVFPESRLRAVYNSIEKYISEKNQVFYVLPLIEESEKVDLKSAVEVYEKLKEQVFTHRTVELLHGRMKQADKELIMEKFRSGKIDILVSTTVIEVGIDIPNANIIVIEHAERFGLAQIHQLRGRVGRGDRESFCVLIHPDNISPESRNRIETLRSTNDGFVISEEDLKQRGAGELVGVKQHGHAGSFEFINLADDIDLIVQARNEAEKIVSSIPDVFQVIDGLKNNRYEKIISGIRKKKILSILS